MLPCHACAYRAEIPGNCHSRCTFDWANASDEEHAASPINHPVSPRTRQWFRFPFNFDPVWGPDTCPAKSETRDPGKVEKPNTLADLLSMLR